MEPQKQYQNATYLGEIITEIEEGQSKNGNKFKKFSIKSKIELINCICWFSMVGGTCFFDGLKLGKKIIAKGFFNNDSELQKEFIIKWFGFPDEETSRKAVERALGGKDKFKEAARNYKMEQRKQGYILAHRINDDGGLVKLGWRKENECVFHKGRWVYRIDYLQEVLGVDFIHMKFKEWLKDKKIVISQGDKLMSFPMGSYKEFLNELGGLAIKKELEQ